MNSKGQAKCVHYNEFYYIEILFHLMSILLLHYIYGFVQEAAWPSG